MLDKKQDHFNEHPFFQQVIEEKIKEIHELCVAQGIPYIAVFNTCADVNGYGMQNYLLVRTKHRTCAPLADALAQVVPPDRLMQLLTKNLKDTEKAH
jgi:hypothetical protein